MVNSSKFKYILRCKSCNSNLISPINYCKKCKVKGPSYFVSQHPNDVPHCLCQKGHSTLATDHVPNFCYSCGSFENEWWETDTIDWISTEIVLKNRKNAIWLVGDFKGDFVGNLIEIGLPRNAELLKNYPRKYDVKITAGLLNNYRCTDNIPELAFGNNPKPLRQDSITSILVKNLEVDEYIPINLVDIVIFDWHKIADKEFLDDRKISGHIYGKLCGCIVNDDEIDEVISQHDQPLEHNIQENNIAETPERFDIPNPIHNTINEQISAPKNLIPPPRLEDTAKPLNENHTDSQPDEVINQHDQTLKQNIQKNNIAETPERLDIPNPISNSNIEPTSAPKNPIQPARTEVIPKPLSENHTLSQPVQKYNYGCLLCNSFFQFLLTIFIFFFLQSTNLSLPFWDVFFCHLLQAAIFYASLKVLCALIKLIKDKNLYLKNLMHEKVLGNALIIIAILCLIIEVANNKGIKCFDISTITIWPFIILFTLLLSSFVHSCLKKFLLSLVFAYALTWSISCDKHTCAINEKYESTSIQHQIDNTQKQVEGLVDEHKANVAEDKIKEITSNNNANHKVTLEELKNNPSALSDCESSLYLGELSIFDRGSAIIKESAESKLNDLADVLNQQSKDTKYIITGHADQTGEVTSDGRPNPIGYANNIKLSKQRAMAVGDWLISHNVINKERLDIRGAGSSEPLTTDSDKELQKLNIRVEISLDCLKDN